MFDLIGRILKDLEEIFGREPTPSSAEELDADVFRKFMETACDDWEMQRIGDQHVD